MCTVRRLFSWVRQGSHPSLLEDPWLRRIRMLSNLRIVEGENVVRSDWTFAS